MSALRRRLGRTATAVDDGERPRARALEDAGVRQDGCRIQPGTTSLGLGAAKPLESTGDNIGTVLSEKACLQQLEITAVGECKM
jgi:hypothetical protein